MTNLGHGVRSLELLNYKCTRIIYCDGSSCFNGHDVEQGFSFGTPYKVHIFFALNLIHVNILFFGQPVNDIFLYICLRHPNDVLMNCECLAFIYRRTPSH